MLILWLCIIVPQTAVAVPPAAVPPVVAPAIPPIVPPVVPERPKRKRHTVDGGTSSSAPINNEISRKRKEFPVTRPCCSFKDIGGSTKVLQVRI